MSAWWECKCAPDKVNEDCRQHGCFHHYHDSTARGFCPRCGKTFKRWRRRSTPAPQGEREKDGESCGNDCNGVTGHAEGCPIHCWCYDIVGGQP